MDWLVKAMSTAYGPLTFLEFRISGGICEVADLPEILENAPKVPAGHGVVISGRGPIWVHSALAHEYHALRWVAHFDPRLGGGVVTQRHHPEAPEIGTIIPIEE